MIFQKINNFFKNNKKVFFYFGFFLLIFYFSSQISFADEATKPAELGADFIKFLNGLFQIVAGILGILTQMIGVLLSPNWVNGNVLGISGYIKDIWILISNIVYLIFAFLLIFIAFMNIVGKGDKWELKQSLPKFIIGILIVPFSWFFVQFIISISSILSAGVLSLPFDTIGKDQASALTDINICVDMTLKKNIGADGSKSKCTVKKPLSTMLKGDGMYGLINVYTYGIFKVDNYETFFQKSTDAKLGLINNIFHLSVTKMFQILLIIVYLILVIALALALFTRMVWLWLYIMFSPVFGLLYFFGKEKEGFGKFSITQFIGLAMIPVYVSAALGFGFLFIFVAGGNNIGTDFSRGTTAGINNTTLNVFQSGSNSVISILDGHFKFTIEGTLVADNEDNIKSLNNFIKGFQGSIGTILMQLFGLAVLWISVMAALKGSKVTGEVVKPIADFGTSVGELIQKSPQYAPVFGGMSAGGLNQAVGMVNTHYSNKSTETGSDFINKYTPFGNDNVSAKTLANEISNGDLLPSEFSRARNELAGKSTKEIKNDVNLKALVAALGEKLGTDEKLYSDGNLSTREGVAKALKDIHNSSKLKKFDSDRLFGGRQIQQGDADFIDTQMAGLSSTGKTQQDSVSSENEPKLKILDNKTVININGGDISGVETKDGKIETLGNAADNLAKYIVDYNITDLDELDKIELSENAKNELNGYFFKNNEGQIIFSKTKQDGYQQSTLEDFLKKDK